MVDVSQIFLGAKIIDVHGLGQGGVNLDGLFERFVAAGLFEILAHLVIDIALESEQLGVASAETVDASE